MISNDKWEFLDLKSFNHKIEVLNDFVKDKIEKLHSAMDKTDKNKNGSFTDKLLMKILDNLHVHFTNINVRIEDTGYSMGVTLKELFIINTNDKWEEEFIDRTNKDNSQKNIFKLLTVVSFGFYININDKLFLSNSPNEVIEKEMALLLGVDDDQVKDANYLIKPISVVAKLKTINDPSLIMKNEDLSINPQGSETRKTIEEVSARNNLFITLDSFHIEIRKQQFDKIIKLLNYISNYQQFQYNYLMTSKYSYFRPTVEKKKGNWKQWWKFAISMVVKQIQYQKGKTDIFMIPNEVFTKYTYSFKSLYKKYYLEKDEMTEEEMKKLKKIVEDVDMKDLIILCKPTIQDIYASEKENKESNLFSFMKKADVSITSEEMNKIEEIIQDSVNMISMSDVEVKLLVSFKLNEGAFKFSTKETETINEGFEFKYTDLFFMTREGESFDIVDSELKTFSISMFTIINNNITTTPITVDEQGQKRGSKSDYFLKVSLRKNKNFTEKFNSFIFLQVNELDFIHNQLFLERLLGFFTVKLEEQLANIARGKLTLIKHQTKQTIMDNISKKNIINLIVMPRRIFVPINKYDIKNSKNLIVSLGKLTLSSKEDTYVMNLATSTFSIDNFKVMDNFSVNVDLDPKTNALTTEVTDAELCVNEYFAALVTYIPDIIKPTKQDIWSQVNFDNEEIKKNCKIKSKVKKKNEVYFNWEPYYAVLSNGFVYFFKNADFQDDYDGYLYLRDAVVKRKAMIIEIKGKYGSVELMFDDEKELSNFVTSVNERVVEMRITGVIEDEAETEIKEKKEEESVLTVKISFKNNSGIVMKDNKELAKVKVELCDLVAKIGDLDYNVNLVIHDALITALNTGSEDVKDVIMSKSPGVPFLDLSVDIIDEHSPKYKNIQFDVSVKVGKVDGVWSPETIRSVLSVFVHNDILRHQIESEISNKTQKNNFISPNKEILVKQRCNEYTYTYINVVVNIKELSIIWINPITLNSFAHITLETSTLSAVLKVDHYDLKGFIGKICIYDLSNYPNGKTRPNHLTDTPQPIAKINDNIKFEYTSMYNWCPHCKDNYLSKVKAQIPGVILNYMHEHTLRCFNYFIDEFLGSLSAGEEVKKFQMEIFDYVPVEEIEFMSIDLDVVSPTIILAPRYYYKEHFLINGDNIHLSSTYYKEKGRVRTSPDESRWITVYDFNLTNITMKSFDNFEIISPINGNIKMHSVNYSERDKIIYDVVDYDYGYTFEISASNVNCNLRQKDFTLLMKCVDLNVTFTDGEEKAYDYESNRITKLKCKENALGTDSVGQTKEAFKEKYNDVVAKIKLENITIKTFIEEKTVFPFAEFQLNEMLIDAQRRLNTDMYVTLKILSIAIYRISLDGSREMIITDTTSSTEENFYQFVSDIVINAAGEKNIVMKLNAIKLIFRYDTVTLLAAFFINGLPEYESSSCDLPYGYDPNDENTPSISLLLEVKQPLICLLTDTLKNKKQNIICLSSEVVVGLKREKVSRVKELMLKNREDKGYIFNLNVSFFNIFPFITTLEELTTCGKNSIDTVKKRKFMDNFMLAYEVKHSIQKVSNQIEVKVVEENGKEETHNEEEKANQSETENYLISIVKKLSLNKIIMNSSFRDMLLLKKAAVDLQKQTSSSKYISTLTPPQKEKGGAKTLDTMYIISQGAQFTLIDDHSDTYYPFISFCINDMAFVCEALSESQQLINNQIELEIYYYNYFAGEWEPLLEMTQFTIDVSIDASDPKNVLQDIHIKTSNEMNINISDIALSFLIKTALNWKERYDGLPSGEKKITNHTVVNYSGRDMNIYQRENDKYVYLTKIACNNSYEIEYSPPKNENEVSIQNSLTNDNYILFDLDNENTATPLVIKNNVVKIDNVASTIHQITSLKSQYNYLISTIRFKKLKKFIYFFSPLSIKNKTNFTIKLYLILSGKKTSRTIELKQNETFAIPHEFLNNGTFCLEMNDIKGKIYQFHSFLNSNEIKEEIDFGGVFVGLTLRGNKYYKNIVLCATYCVYNCLPFELQFVMNDVNAMYFIGKQKKEMIHSISRKRNLRAFLFFGKFHTMKEYLIGSKSIPITLEDNDGQSLTIYANITNSLTTVVVIHANGILVNHSGLDLKFHALDNKIEIPKFVRKFQYCLLNEDKYIILSTKLNKESYSSKKVQINAIGTTSIVQLTSESGRKIELVMQINLSLMNAEIDLFTTIVTFVPKMVVVNNLKYDVIVMNEMEKIEIPKGSKGSMYSFESRDIFFCVDDNKISTPMPILSGSHTTLKCYENNSTKEFIYFNADKKVDSLTTYIILSEATMQNARFTIENLTKIFNIKVRQKNYEEFSQIIFPDTQVMFTWNNSSADCLLCLAFNSIQLTFAQELIYEIQDDKIISDYSGNEISYPFKEVVSLEKHKIEVSVKAEGMNLRMVIRDHVDPDTEETEDQLSNYEVNFFVPKLGLSIIGDNRASMKKNTDFIRNYARNEIIYVCFEENLFYVKMKKKIRKNNVVETTNEIQLVVRDIEIDNQITRVKQFPIVLMPTERRKKKRGSANSSANQSNLTTTVGPNAPSFTMNGSILNPSVLSDNDSPSRQPFANFAIFTTKTNDGITKINLLNYLIQEFVLNLESSVIVGLINFVNSVNAGLTTTFTEINPVFLPSINGELIPSWMTNETQSMSNTLFISHLSASSLEIELTFINQTKDKVFQKVLQSNKILASLLSTISNIEKVHIKLNGCELNNFSGDAGTIISNILYVYQQKMLIAILKLFGAIDLIGDPLNLLTSLGKGFKDFFQKPAKGMMKGPIQGAIGLIDGTFSLARHTIAGTFSSTSKITSGISKGMLMLTLDDDYINKRERRKITQRPKNALQGIGYGLTSMAGGLFYGVTDIVKKPIEGARKEKLKGLGKGLIKGLSGVVLKPISGVFDLVSKTTEGIKNNVKSEDKSKPKRVSRPFYGRYKVFRAYSEIDAKVIEILESISELKNSPFDYYASEIYKNSKEDKVLLACLTKGVYVIDILRKELILTIEYNDIKEITEDPGNIIKIKLNKKIISIAIFDQSNEAGIVNETIKESMRRSREEASDF